jgi:molybdopterin molybdotransferase
LVERDGGLLLAIGTVDRNLGSIRAAAEAGGADIVIMLDPHLGLDATSVTALANSGELAFHGIALRPGETACGGRLRDRGTAVFLLPATPLACLWTYELLAGRAVRRLGGRCTAPPYPARKMTTARKIISAIGSVEVCPVRHVGSNEVQPIAYFGTGLVAAADADGFIIIPEESEGFPQGSTVMVHIRREDILLNESARP